MKIETKLLKEHPFNSIFGNLPDNEFESLKRDINERGMQTTIDITEDNVIVCGHQRARACNDLGIEEVNVRVLKGWDDNRIKEHLIKDNILRRQLNEFQIVEAGKELEKLYDGRHGIRHDSREGKISLSKKEEGRTRDLVAKDFGISGRTYDNYKKLYEKVSKEKIEKAKKFEISIKDIKKEEREKKIQQQRDNIKSEIIESPKGEYDVIVIDPPWPYNRVGTSYDPEGNRAMMPYPEMSIEELKQIKIPSKDDCILWLWVTNAFMKEAYELLDAWGFQDKTILTWDKQFLGAGWWLRNITEHCILAIKGEPRKKGYFNNKKYTTLISEKRTTHSTKPELFYKLVEETCVGRKLDYFARKEREGWDVYGDEIKT